MTSLGSVALSGGKIKNKAKQTKLTAGSVPVPH